MSEGKTNNIEIDMGQFFKTLLKGFKGVLKILVAAFLFYKKKWLLFSILFIIGAVGGYFLEKAFDLNKRYKQEIVLAPNYNTSPYIYGFIESLDTKFKDKPFLKKIALDSIDLLHLKKITLKPIVESTDILDELQLKYNGQNFFKHFMENYSDEAYTEGKYKNFYKHHMLTLVFTNKSANNGNVSKQLLNYLSSNEYYNKTLSLTLKQTQSNLDRNKETLAFVEEYLDKLSKKPFNEDKEIIVVGEESKIPTIASLLDKKENLQNKISFQERVLSLNTKLFDVVEQSSVVRFPIAIYKRAIVLAPILLCVLVSIIFLLKYSSGRIEEFIND